MVLVVIDHDRYHEWKALYNFCCEHRIELEEMDRMKALVLCMQRHWQEAVKEVPDDF